MTLKCYRSMLFVVAARKLLPFASALAVGVAGLLFATHPIHTEVVCNINNRAELLSAIFMLLSFLTYSDAIGPNDRVQFRARGILAAVMLAATATLCKEQGFTVLLVNVAYDASLVCGLNILDVRDAIMRRNHVKDDKKGSKSARAPIPAHVVALAKRTAVSVAGLVAILLLRAAMYARPETHDQDTNRM